MSVRADAETFRSIPIFADCDPVHLQVVAFSAQRQSFESGQDLVRQGQKHGFCFLILSGQAEILVDRDGSPESVGYAGPGAMIGEVSMIADIASTVTVRAKDNVTAARVDRDLFFRVTEEYPEFGKRVFEALARKLNVTLSEFSAARDYFERARSFSDL